MPATPDADRSAPPPAVSGRPPVGRVLRTWLCVFAAALLLYTTTASRSIQWQDSGDRILRIMTGDLMGSLGLALVHPLHYWLGRFAVTCGPANPALAITLVSAVAGAFAVANVFGCVRRVTGSVPGALFAAASLAVAHTFWQMATLTETYTLAAALLAGELWCLAAFLDGRRPALFGMFLLNGLGVANHLLAGLTSPLLAVVSLYAWKQRRIAFRHLLLSTLIWVIASLPYSGLVVLCGLRSGNWPATIRSALFGTVYAENVLNTSLSPFMLVIAGVFVVYNFPSLLLASAALGIARGRRTTAPGSVWAVFLAALVIHLGFVLRYNIKDQQTFFLPTYTLLAVFGGIGAAYVLGWPPSPARRAIRIIAFVLLVLTPALYAATPLIARRLHVLDGFARKPYRDNYVYLFIPWSRADTSAARMARDGLALSQPDGVIFYEDRTSGSVMRYAVARGGHGRIQTDSMPHLDRERGRADFTQLVWRADGSLRPVLLIPADVGHLAAPTLPGLEWVPAGEFFVLRRTTPPESRPATNEPPAGASQP